MNVGESVNSKLLYHGSSMESWVGILSRGLLLPSPDHLHSISRSDPGMLGFGIYFSDNPFSRYFSPSPLLLFPSSFPSLLLPLPSSLLLSLPSSLLLSLPSFLLLSLPSSLLLSFLYFILFLPPPPSPLHSYFRLVFPFLKSSP